MSKKDKRVLVTGGLGFIGSKLSERLSQDCHVTVVDNLRVFLVIDCGR